MDVETVNIEINQCDEIINSVSSDSTLFYAHLVRAKHLLAKDFTTATQDIIEAKNITNRWTPNSREQVLLRMLEIKAFAFVRNYDRVLALLDEVDAEIRANNDTALSIISRDWRARALSKIDRAYLATSIINGCMTDLVQIDNTVVKNLLKTQLSSSKSTLLTFHCVNDTSYIDLTIEALDKTINLAKQENLKGIEYEAYGDLAYIFFLKGDYKKALSLAKIDLKHSKEIGFRSSESVLHSILAQIYFKLRQNDQALTHIDKANDMLNHFSYYPFLKQHLTFCREFYRSIGKTNEGFDNIYYQLIKLSDLQRDQFQRNFDLHEAKEQLQNTKQDLAELESINRLRNRVMTLLIFIVIIFILFLFIIYKNKRKIQSQKDELSNLNESLEVEVVKRTNKILDQNQKIKEFAYHNSHHTRAPVARLMGLMDLLEYDDGSVSMDVIQMIREETEKVDEVIFKMNEILDEEG